MIVDAEVAQSWRMNSIDVVDLDGFPESNCHDDSDEIVHWMTKDYQCDVLDDGQEMASLVEYVVQSAHDEVLSVFQQQPRSESER